VGSAGFWLHDGQATTLTEAILRHGGEAQAAQAQFAQLATPDQDVVITFLQSLVAPVFFQL
jgi:CxxC motif-containing protein (DUF1111 family)